MVFVRDIFIITMANLPKNAKPFRVGHVNIRSLLPSIDDVRGILADLELDFLGVSETWLSVDIPASQLKINGFDFYRVDRYDRGGGVGFYVKHNYQANVLNIKEVDEMVEQIWATIKINSVVLGIGVIYRPPRFNAIQSLNILESSVSDIIPLCDELLVMGDLNINLLKQNNVTDAFDSFLNTFNLSQVVREPTRCLAEASSLLDVVMLSDDNLLSGSVHHRDMHDATDHQLLFCDLNIAVPKAPPKLICFRDFKNFDKYKFNQDLHNVDWNNVFYQNSIDDKVNLLTCEILKLFDFHAPFRTVRVTKPKAPWFTENLKILKQYRNHLLSKYKKSKNIQHWEDYKRARNLFTSSVRNEKRAYLDYVNRQQDKKKIWNTLKEMNVYKRKKDSVDVPKHLKQPDKINDFFIDSICNINSSVNLQTLDMYNKTKATDNVFQFLLLREADIFNAIQQLKSNASGTDHLSLEMIKLCCPTIVPVLVHIFNSCIEDSTFPSYWKNAIVVPYPKTSDPKSLSELRPISLLPVLSKIFEQLLHSQILTYLNENNLIPTCQSGFRKGHSTSSALVKVLDDLVRNTDEGRTSALILLDYSKAFDVLDHRLLCAKLSHYGFSERTVGLINSYLSDRTQVVRVDGSLSKPRALQRGVPQGTVMGPLLFVMFTMDMVNHMHGCGMHQYADDTQLYISFSKESTVDIEEKLNRLLQSMHDYSINNGLKINAIKSAIMYFGVNRVWASQNVNATINGVEIKVVEEYKNLGVTLDYGMRFRTHVNKIVQKCYVALRDLYKNKLVLNRGLRKLLAESLVLSNCTYCDFVFMPFLDLAYKYKLQKIQNSCIRFIFDLKREDHVSHKLSELRWLNMSDRCKLHFACFLHKVRQSGMPLYIKNKLNLRSSIHDRSTRNRQHFDIPKHRTALFQRSFSYLAPRLLNTDICRKYESLAVASFRRKYMEFLLISY